MGLHGPQRSARLGAISSSDASPKNRSATTSRYGSGRVATAVRTSVARSARSEHRAGRSGGARPSHPAQRHGRPHRRLGRVDRRRVRHATVRRRPAWRSAIRTAIRSAMRRTGRRRASWRAIGTRSRRLPERHPRPRPGPRGSDGRRARPPAPPARPPGDRPRDRRRGPRRRSRGHRFLAVRFAGGRGSVAMGDLLAACGPWTSDTPDRPMTMMPWQGRSIPVAGRGRIDDGDRRQSSSPPSWPDRHRGRRRARRRRTRRGRRPGRRHHHRHGRRPPWSSSAPSSSSSRPDWPSSRSRRRRRLSPRRPRWARPCPPRAAQRSRRPSARGRLRRRFCGRIGRGLGGRRAVASAVAVGSVGSVVGDRLRRDAGRGGRGRAGGRTFRRRDGNAADQEQRGAGDHEAAKKARVGSHRVVVSLGRPVTVTGRYPSRRRPAKGFRRRSRDRLVLLRVGRDPDRRSVRGSDGSVGAAPSDPASSPSSGRSVREPRRPPRSRGREAASADCARLVTIDDEPAQTGRLELRPERVDIADQHDRRAVDREVRPRSRLDGVDIDRLDALLGSRSARRAAGRARPVPTAPRRRRRRSRTATGTRRRGSRAPPRARRRSTRVVAHPLELGERVDDGRHGHLGVDGGTGGEWPGASAHVEPGAGAVRVALRLAQLHVQPRVEQPAEDRAHHGHRVEVRDAAGQTGVADPDLGLDAARAMDDANEATGAGRPCRRSAPRRDGVGDAAPATEQPLGDRRRRPDRRGPRPRRASRAPGRGSARRPRRRPSRRRGPRPSRGCRRTGRWYGDAGA